MNILICGAGTVGSHAAAVLSEAGHNVTIVDIQADRLKEIEDRMDVRTLQGNVTYGEVLLRANVKQADLLFAATNSDEINLLAAAIGKGIGAKQTVARVRHSAYFEEKGVDYDAVLGIDHFICPEYSTAQAIASSLRNPGALAIENFAAGAIEMQQLAVDAKAPAVGQALASVGMPAGTRVAALLRGGEALIPEARTRIEPTDSIVLVGNREAFQEARKLFTNTTDHRLRRVVMMGGSTMAVWLCRALKDRDFSIRLFDISRARAEELAEKLGWVTVIHADPTDPAVFQEEHIEDADAFVSLRTDDDEHNILAGAWAKSMGAKMAIATVQRPNYLRLMKEVGIDRPFAPRVVAVRELENLIDDRRLHHVASLAAGSVAVFQVTINKKAAVVGKALREIKLAPDWIIAAIQHDGKAHVPGADDVLEAGDVALVVGKEGEEKKLHRLLS